MYGFYACNNHYMKRSIPVFLPFVSRITCSIYRIYLHCKGIVANWFNHESVGFFHAHFYT